MKLALACPILALLTGEVAAEAIQDKFHVTEEEHAACDSDAISLCSDAYPDQDKLLVCMRSKQAQLSPTCRPVFQAGMRRRHLPL